MTTSAPTAGGLNRVAMKQRAVAPRERGDFADRLDDAGLVVRKHHGDQRRSRIGGEKPVEGIKRDDSVAVDRNRLRRRKHLTDRIVLDGGDEDSLPVSTEQGKVIRLGTAADEHHTTRIDTAEQPRDFLTRALDYPPRHSAPAMDR